MPSTSTEYYHKRLSIVNDIVNLCFSLARLQFREIMAIPLQDFHDVKKDMQNMLYTATKPRQRHE
jgi:hypothetical protein